MDLEAARKSLSKKPSAFSTKKIAFIAAAGLVLLGGIGLRAYHYLGEAPADSEPAAVQTPATEPVVTPEPTSPSPVEATESVPKTPPPTQQAAPVPETPAAQQAAPVPAPGQSEPAEQAGDTAEPTAPDAAPNEQADLPGSGVILVSRKPVEVLASPSASAPAMYGFPAGRPFRVIGREGNFVHIQDLRSSASGWIDASALAAPPPSRTPSVAAPSQTKPTAGGRKPATASADPKPKPARKRAGAPVTADSEPSAETDSAQARRPPSLFGRGGFFGGVFGGRNSN
jgi:hypothetical protein